MTILRKAKKIKNMNVHAKFAKKPSNARLMMHKYAVNAQKNIFFDNEERKIK